MLKRLGWSMLDDMADGTKPETVADIHVDGLSAGVGAAARPWPRRTSLSVLAADIEQEARRLRRTAAEVSSLCQPAMSEPRGVASTAVGVPFAELVAVVSVQVGFIRRLYRRSQRPDLVGRGLRHAAIRTRSLRTRLGFGPVQPVPVKSGV